MALEMKYKLNGDLEIVGYIRPGQMYVSKSESGYICKFNLEIRSGKGKNIQDTWGAEDFVCKYDIENAENMVKQIYSFLKTHTAFVDAVDV